MRIVIDLQGAQSSGSRNRGIGRYTEALTQAICQNRVDHDIHLILSNSFSQTIEPLRAKFEPLISVNNIHIFDVFTPTDDSNIANLDRRNLNEAMREAFIAQLSPDVVLITSLFEGLGDNSVTSIKTFNNIPTAVVLYDLIPFIYNKIYLENPIVESWYLRKIDHLKRADLLLSISASSGQEAINYLNIDQHQVVNISTACDEQFKPIILTEQDYSYLEQQYGIEKSFVMYTGGIDHRKNIEGLIRAYAALPLVVRQKHQLVIVCSVQEVDRKRLTQLAQKHGLESGDYIMTGFVPEADLIKLYNACKLFVFPSWHEGFGLPALEAMQCGKPVLVSNTSSLPEVVENIEALFDPRNDENISEKLLHTLTDDYFRESLARHAIKQAEKFNWNDIANRTIAALLTLHTSHNKLLPLKRPRLAYVSPLPPERSGISDYSAELLQELTRWYQVDVIVSQNEVSDTWVKANCPLRTVEWFKANSHQFERVLYHFGNSHFHQHMFDLLETIPGVVTLHDFFLSGIQHYRDVVGLFPKEWKKNLYHSHGYQAVWRSENESYLNEAMWRYPTNLKVIQDALGVIVHSESSIGLAKSWYGQHVAEDWKIIPLLRTFPKVNSKHQARAVLGIDENAFLICSFGHINETKQNLKVVEAFINSKLSADENCYLVFVGQQDPTKYGMEIEQLIARSKMTTRISITGWADAEQFKLYLQAADAGIQLRTLSRGETSASVLDCMNYGLATIVNANGSMADLDPSCVYILPDDFTDDQLVIALESVYENEALKVRLSQNAVEKIRTVHSPRRCAALYAEAIEGMYAQQQQGLLGLINNIQYGQVVFEQDNLRKFANNFPATPSLKQIFVDVSTLAVTNTHSGIQRVVRSVLNELLNSPPKGYRIEPVMATSDQLGYFYARQFTCNFMGINDCSWFTNEEIEFVSGDIFLGLDLQQRITISQKDYLLNLKNKGVKITYVVYDLLALLKSEYFIDSWPNLHYEWLKTISIADQLLCISSSVADELHNWLNTFGEKRDKPLCIDWFHLGADIENSVPTLGFPENSHKILTSLKAKPTFLMVGTLEPRKGYKQTLDAFEQLWHRGIQVNLVFVGERGWLIEEFIDQLENHQQLGHLLFWLESVSDEYLAAIYDTSSCLIAASYGEGFGLPLIEAARHNIPIIARDIPVFREVASNYALYFEDRAEPQVITEVVEKWLDLYKIDQQPKSVNLTWLTWQQSTQQLLDALFIKKSNYSLWQGNENLLFWGNDPRLSSQTGKRIGKQIKTVSEAGFLIFGPYHPLKAGAYQVTITGSWQHLTGNEIVDMAYEQGTQKIFKLSLSKLLSESDQSIQTTFNIANDIGDFEIRIWVEQNTQLSLNEIRIDTVKPEDVELKVNKFSNMEDLANVTFTNNNEFSSDQLLIEHNAVKVINNIHKTTQNRRKRQR